VHECDKIFGDVCMVKDVDKEYSDTMEEVMLELKLKTDKFLQKLKEQNKYDRFKY